MTLTGVNDIATIDGEMAATLIEDGDDSQLVATGSLTIVDPDTDEALFTPQANVEGRYGTFTLAETGAWRYTADNTQTVIQALSEGETLTDTLTAVSRDGTGSQTLTFTLTGVNDVAVIEGQTTGTLTEDTAAHLTARGTLTVTDVDTNEARFEAQADVTGLYGRFTLTEAGAWHYTVDNTQEAIQGLAADNTLTETFTAHSVDGTANQEITLTLTGINDAAVVAGIHTGEVVEDSAATTLVASGALTITDPDQNEAGFVAQAETVGVYGTFALEATGGWTYTADNTQTAIQSLVDGETLTERFTAISLDGTANQEITLTLTGINDEAVIAGEATGTVTEDGAATTLTAQNRLTIVDPDQDEAAFAPQTDEAGTYGTFTLDRAGAWSYTADNTQTAIQSLPEGETLTETFTAISLDGTATREITITLTGVNDDASVEGETTGAVTEDDAATLTARGTLTVVDPDQGEARFVVQTGTTGDHGTFFLDEMGAWNYTVDNTLASIQGLVEGEMLTETFTAVSLDGTATQAIILTLTGINDEAVVEGETTGALTEDGAASLLTAAGTLTITDPDRDEAVFVVQTDTAGEYGTFTLEGTGAWRYSTDNTQTHIQALPEGETLTETFTAVSMDGTASQEITLTLTGINDDAVIEGETTGTLTEDEATATLTASGALTIVDPDRDEARFVEQSEVAGTYGNWNLTETGVWTYTADNTQQVIQALPDGETLTETFTVTSVDGTATQEITVTLTGINDDAVVAGERTGALTEDETVTALTASGTLTIVDIDQEEALFVAQANTTGEYGTFLLEGTGAWRYTVDNTQATIQSLPEGEILTETFTAVSMDGTATQDVTLTLTGINDEAVVEGVADAALVEDAAAATLTAGDILTVTDPDRDEAFFVVQAETAGNYGTFSLADNGTWSYTADNTQTAIQSLPEGEILTETFTAASLDGTATQEITLTLTGINDEAVIGGTTLGTLTEDETAASLTVSGLLSIEDIDTGEAVFIAQADVTGLYGTWALESDGNWHYTADNTQAAIQSLPAGATLTETFTAESRDGTATQEITLTLTGINDEATIAGDATGALTEDAAATLTAGGTLTATDVDTEEARFTVQDGTAGLYGLFNLTDSGAWTYTADGSLEAIQSLPEGATLTETFTAVSLDGTATQEITLTLTGINDEPVITGTSTGNLTEDQATPNLVANGALIIDDVDQDESLFVAQSGTVGLYGTFALTTDGNWTYTASNTLAAIQSLPAGATLTDTFEAHSQDGTQSQEVTLTLTGINDEAAIGGTTTAFISEDDASSLTASGTLTITDVDTDENLFAEQLGTAGSYGVFTVATDGTWTYTANNAQTIIQSLPAGFILTDTVTAVSADGTASQAVIVTLTGINDTATITGSISGNVTEDNETSTLTTGGTLLVTDVDISQAMFITQTATQGDNGYGSFTLANNGVWTYTADNTQTAIQSLPAASTLTDTFTTQSVDGTATRLVTVTITGINDLPVIGGVSTGGVTEDATTPNITTSGALTITDVDTGEALFVAQTGTVGSGGYGTFTLDTIGNWSYTTDTTQAVIQNLPLNATLTDTFTAVSLDTTGTQVVTVTLTGVNDAPTITGTSTQAITDKVTGALFSAVTLADVDTGDTLTLTLTLTGAASAGANGIFSTLGDGTNDFITSDGGATYTLSGVTVTEANASLQALVFTPTENQITSGTTLDTTFQLQVDDGNDVASDATTVLTVTSINDDPTITGTSTQAITDKATATLFSAVTVADVDVNELFTLTLTLSGAASAGANGTFTTLGTGGYDFITSDGGITYTLSGVTEAQANNSLQALVFTPTENQVAPALTVDTTFQLQVDDGDATVSDTTTVLTVTSINDAPTLAGTTPQTIDDNVTATPFSGATVSDVDVDETFNLTITLSGPASAGENGMFTTLGTGGYNFTTSDGGITYTLNGVTATQANNALQALVFTPTENQVTPGSTVVTTFQLQADDGDGPVSDSTTVLTVTSVNDAAIITGTTTGAVTEDASDPLTAAGTLSVTDVDVGQASFATQASTAGNNGYGTFTLDAGGNWSYSASNGQGAVQNLPNNATMTDSFTASSLDGTSQQVTVTFTGVNDTASISGTATGTVTEDGTTTASGTLTVTDLDSGENVFGGPGTIGGSYGTFTLNAGSWSYALDNAHAAVQALNTGQTLSDSITAYSADNSASQLISVTIDGETDAASVVNSNVGYYDTSLQSGDSPAQSDRITAAGLTPIMVSTPNASGLSGLGVLFVENDGGWAGYASFQGDITTAVNNGMTLVVNDWAVGTAATYLPGGAGLVMTNSVSAIINLDASAPAAFTTGPGGTLTHDSLDNGNSSNHGYALRSSLPAGYIPLMDDGISVDNLVGFAYPYGLGYVVYSTIPLSHYYGGSTPVAFKDVYAPNIIYYGASLVDPIVIDLDGDGIQLAHAPMATRFAMSPDNLLRPDAWLNAGDGFLVLDKDSDGQINDITEMFSEFFVEDASTGLGALSTLDANQDGLMDAQDPLFSQLAIWQDRNADAITDEGELQTLADWGILSIALNATTRYDTVEGGVILSQGSVAFEDRVGQFSEVAFRVHAVDAEDRTEEITPPSHETGSSLSETAMETDTDGILFWNQEAQRTLDYRTLPPIQPDAALTHDAEQTGTAYPPSGIAITDLLDITSDFGLLAPLGKLPTDAALQQMLSAPITQATRDATETPLMDVYGPDLYHISTAWHALFLDTDVTPPIVP